MGSDSDLPIMKAAAEFLEEIGLPFEMSVISAHRTPDRAVEYARTSAGRGLNTIIAGAGGAAHLPGVLAALTELPVIGVPIRGSSLEGLDSLLSIVQMPRGIPVATVGINNAKNAAILAARIIAVKDAGLRKRLTAYAESMEKGVLEKAERLESVGYKAYLKNRN
jgi:phosphoribosylaminoimidazole carboxylase PurE protein